MGKGSFPARIALPGPVAIYETCCGHFFSSAVFNLCSVDAGLSMGYFPICGEPPGDLFADHLSFHQPAFFFKLVQEWCISPQHLPATMAFLGSPPSASLSGSSTASRKDLRSPVTSMNSQSVSGPLPPLSTSWAKCS